jgi:ribosomal protein L24
MTKTQEAAAQTITTGTRVEITRGNKRGQSGTVTAIVGEMHILRMDRGHSASVKVSSLKAV